MFNTPFPHPHQAAPSLISSFKNRGYTFCYIKLSFRQREGVGTLD